MQSTLFREKVLKRFHFHNLFNLFRSIPNKSLIQSVQVDLTANDEGGLLPTEKLCLRLSSFLAPADAFETCRKTLQQCCWWCWWFFANQETVCLGAHNTKIRCAQCAWVHETSRSRAHNMVTPCIIWQGQGHKEVGEGQGKGSRWWQEWRPICG